MGNMYADAKTWNPFKGCHFDCVYCRPSYQAQAKRQKHRCQKCYEYVPHTHPERLSRIPGGSRIVFACGNGDLSFCPHEFRQSIVDAIRMRNERYPERTYYLQSKAPWSAFSHLELPGNVVLVTTLETNRDEGYDQISKAPEPSARWEAFRRLDHARKVLTLEPLLDFDFAAFLEMILAVRPEYVWAGYNTRPRAVQLPEPAPVKVDELIRALESASIEVRRKDLR